MSPTERLDTERPFFEEDVGGAPDKGNYSTKLGKGDKLSKRDLITTKPSKNTVPSVMAEDDQRSFESIPEELTERIIKGHTFMTSKRRSNCCS